MAFTKVTGPGIHTLSNITSHHINSSGIITAVNFSGPMSGTTGSFTNINVTGIGTIDGVKIASGIVTASSSTGVTTYYGDASKLTGLTASQIPNLAASKITSGTVATARLGSGTANNSTFLRGDQSWASNTSTTINSNTNNYLITGTGTADTLQGESGLTFDGSQLTVAGKIACDVNSDIAMSNTANGQLKIGGNGYTSAIALNTDGMQIYHNSSSRGIIFGINETEALRIASDGKVGIGTNNPQKTLNVFAGVGTTELVRLSQPVDASVQQNFGIGWCSNNNHTWPGAQITSLEYDVSDTRRSLLFYTRGTNQDIAPTERLRITSAGLVGINTNNPGANLTVWANDGDTDTDVFQVRSKTGAFNIQVSDSNASNPEWALRTYSSEPIVFKQATTERLRIGSSGEIYLGTSNWPTSSFGKAASRTIVGDEGLLTVWNETNSAGGGGTLKLACKEGSNSARVGFANLVGGTENTSDRSSFFKIDVSNSTGSGIERLRINSTGQLELRKNQGGVTGRPENRIVFRDLDSSVAANQPIGEISWHSTDAGNPYVNSWIRGINEHTNGNGALLFGVKASGSDEIEALRITSAGLVGIGTHNPDEKLEVYDGNIQQYNSNASGGTGLILQNYAGGGGGNTTPYSFIRAKSNPIRNAGEIRFGRDSAYGSSTEADSHMSFWTALNDTNTERLRITSAGNIGISTSVPSTAQDLTFDGASNYKAGIFYRQAGVSQYRFMCEGGTGHVYYDTFVDGGDHIFRTNAAVGASEKLRITEEGTVQFGTSGTLKAEINNAVSGHQFISQCDDNNNGFEVYQQHGSTHTRASFAVYDNKTGSKDLSFKIDGAGWAYFNTTSNGTTNGNVDKRYNIGSTNNANVAFQLTTRQRYSIWEHRQIGRTQARTAQMACGETSSNQGTVIMYSSIANSDVTGGVNLTNGATSWSGNSDMRLKNKTGDILNALEDINKIEPLKFTWKYGPDNNPHVGVSAQSVQNVVPEAIDMGVDVERQREGDETEYMKVRYTELIPLSIAAIKELKAEVESLKAEIASLKSS